MSENGDNLPLGEDGIDASDLPTSFAIANHGAVTASKSLEKLDITAPIAHADGNVDNVDTVPADQEDQDGQPWERALKTWEENQRKKPDADQGEDVENGSKGESLANEEDKVQGDVLSTASRLEEVEELREDNGEVVEVQEEGNVVSIDTQGYLHGGQDTETEAKVGDTTSDVEYLENIGKNVNEIEIPSKDLDDAADAAVVTKHDQEPWTRALKTWEEGQGEKPNTTDQAMEEGQAPTQETENDSKSPTPWYRRKRGLLTKLTIAGLVVLVFILAVSLGVTRTNNEKSNEELSNRLDTLEDELASIKDEVEGGEEVGTLLPSSGPSSQPSSLKGVVMSKLDIHVPESLNKPDGYEHREALFGIPPYGGSIAQQMYYANDDLCDFNNIDTRGGYPIRARDDDGNRLPWQSPYILMVDRSGCTFVQKVRNAQRVGAAGVIIADNSCLCAMEASGQCHSDPGHDCEEREPIMADDGSGTDITIPTFLMFKSDADAVKAEVEANHPVRIEMTWSQVRHLKTLLKRLKKPRVITGH